MAKKKTTTRLTGMEKALRKDREGQRTKKPDPLDTMLKKHQAERAAEAASAAEQVARTRTAVVAVLGELPFEQPGYHVLDIPAVREARHRNNIDRPSYVGATIDALTTTCAVLYYERARAALAVGDLVAPQLDFLSKMREVAAMATTMRNFLRRVPRDVLVEHHAHGEMLEMLDAP